MKAVFIDVHGVLLDFITGLEKHTLVTFPDMPVSLHGHLGLSEKELWCSLNNVEFWRTLPSLESGQQLLRILSVMCRDLHIPLYVCTRPMFHSLAALEGTIMALCDDFGVDFTKIVITSDKQVCANRAFLVDDQADNCDNWKQAGGECFQWPCRFNGFLKYGAAFQENMGTLYEMAMADLITAFMNWATNTYPHMWEQ